MGEVLVKLMESPFAPFILLVLFWFGYRSLKHQINGVGRKERAIISYMLESEQDEVRRQRLNDLLKG